MTGTSGFKGSGITDPFLTPDAPTVDSVSAGVLSADVTISAPADTGGAAIDSYVVTAKQSDGTSVTGTASAAGTVSVTLTAGGTTTFAAQALNKYGAGQFSGFGNSTSVFSGQELYAFGEGGNGRLGDGTMIDRSSPVQIGALTTWDQVSTNRDFSFGLIDNKLYAWGSETFGQLGNNASSYRSLSPIQIGSLTNWAFISAGYFHAHAIKTDGTLWGWGRNNDGQVGDNTITYRSSPVQIGALTNWSVLASGDTHSLAIKTDGTLWGIGNTFQGQLGLNVASTRRSSPVQIGSLTNWTAIGCGDYFSFGIAGGELYAWGNNERGQLGDNTTVNRSSPVQVGALTNWSSVAGGTNHGLAIKTDGTLWAWGLNGYGNLGTNNTVYTSSPVQVGSLTSWTVVSAGKGSSIGIESGKLYAWGQNDHGQNGDNAIVNTSSPVQVGSGTSWTDAVKGVDQALVLLGSTS